MKKPQTQSARSAAPSRKRKLAGLYDAQDEQALPTPAKLSKPTDQATDTTTTTSSQPSKAKSKSKTKEKIEKRQRMFRKKAPKSFLEKLERAQMQRMVVVSRTRSEAEGCPKEDIDIVGSTGNIYTVTIGQLASCTCPDSKKGNECKHKVYALSTILKAPEHLVYQLAFLSSELGDIFEGAPPIPTEVTKGETNDGARKPVEGECPICYMDLEEESNELVWCKAACGNNVHKSCFEQWAASQRGSTVKCVYCRTPWEMDRKEIDAITKMGITGEDGYVNVADHFGMSRARDYSSYHQPWVRNQFGMGW